MARDEARWQLICVLDTKLEERIAWHRAEIDKLERIRRRAWTDYGNGHEISDDIDEGAV